MILDPDSPLDAGRCICGEPVELGDHHCGYLVGWIDVDGQAWESRQERDIALTSGRYLDAWRAWNRTGGLLGPPPDLDAIIADLDVLPQHEDEARREARRCEDPDDLWTRAGAWFSRNRARLN